MKVEYDQHLEVLQARLQTEVDALDDRYDNEGEEHEQVERETESDLLLEEEPDLEYEEGLAAALLETYCSA